MTLTIAFMFRIMTLTIAFMFMHHTVAICILRGLY